MMFTFTHLHLHLPIDSQPIRARGIIFIYHKDSHYYDPTNKKVIGKFKYEAAGVPITEFVGLRSK